MMPDEEEPKPFDWNVELRRPTEERGGGSIDFKGALGAALIILACGLSLAAMIWAFGTWH